eukprot:2437001-Rhodomonas_salina.2
MSFSHPVQTSVLRWYVCCTAKTISVPDSDVGRYDYDHDTTFPELLRLMICCERGVVKSIRRLRTGCPGRDHDEPAARSPSPAQAASDRDSARASDSDRDTRCPSEVRRRQWAVVRKP